MFRLTDRLERSLVGNKAYNLSLLSGCGKIVDGFVICADEPLAQESLASVVMPSNTYCVRSSSNMEDGQTQSHAGQFMTLTNVAARDLYEAITRVRAYNPVNGQRIPVLVQRNIDTAFAGVAFTRHPVSRWDVDVLEYVRGSGEQLVSGKVTPTTLVRKHGVVSYIAGEKSLPAEQIHAVCDLARRCENYFGCPQDIEWGIERETHELYLFQSRAITTIR
ncbi:MAG TPA: PEP/pyruvate-binding domain-containing protein [Acidobacteriota bacterium]|nr:PEP/pyruvate-binding domain-containing protein [Acidobacteriota bacterium]